MAREVRPAVKAIMILMAIGILYAGYRMADRFGLMEKIAPTGKQTAGSALSDDAKDAAKKGTPIVRVGVVTWGGYAGGEYYNGGFEASTASRYFKDKGILVEFVVIDDFKASRDAWKADKIDMLWGTADSFPTEVDGLKEFEPQIVMQADWSRGGDAIVVKHGINNVRQLADATIAVALGTPSHSLLLNTFDAGDINYNERMIKTTDSAIAAAQMFKSGAVDAAVVWSPDDADCVKNVPGSKILVNTKKAGNIIADIFFVKKKFLEKNRDVVAKVVQGWLQGAAEINGNQAAREEAVRILMKGLNIDESLARISLDNVRLTTYGDNENFFGLNSSYRGVTGEDLYNRMNRMYTRINLSPSTIPPWRNVADSSIIREITLSGPDNEAEGMIKFAAPTRADEKAHAYANKPLTVSYDFGSARLTGNGKTIIDMGFADTARQFSQTRIRIEGNTDSIGSAETNKRLSYARANSVANYLVEKYGFDRRRFVIVGNGADAPVPGCEANDTEDCRAKNRRTEFSLLN
jgi:NitT/TauT family transport system substrate-binding protein